MFEAGEEIKAKVGEKNLFDFSLGNPDLPPPKQFQEKLHQLTSLDKKGEHGYMPNAGFPLVRQKIAKNISQSTRTSLSAQDIIMTCGAAGGLNVILKTILNPKDEVIILKPYFVEYLSYVDNHQGKIILVETNQDFSLNLKNIAQAITPKTKAILINSPNNPTGKIYSPKEIKGLAELLKKQKKIYLISDEPYKEIVYDNLKVPNIFNYYHNSIIVTSYSKTLSIAGERIGYIAVNPLASDKNLLINGLTLSNRILGFVNAPALMQKVITSLNKTKVNLKIYQRRRDIFVKGLKEAGYKLYKPEGAFYLFCQSPHQNDLIFVEHLQKYNILVVPGTGFGRPGYFRISFTVSEKKIKASLPKFKEALASFRKK